MAEEPQATETDVTEETEAKETPKTYTQEELDKEIEREAERRVAKAKKGWDEQLDGKLSEAKTEGAKLAKMSAQEKADAEAKERADKLAAREAELNKRELTANVRDVLAEKDLPSELADPLVALGDADLINQTADSISRLISERVNKEVDNKLSGGGKPTGEPSQLEDNDDPFKKILNKYKK
ncbi:hypothetical protein LMG30237_ALEAABJJ_00412 [Fructobacillus tropaeoli]|uniref:DUF4355 domain-containing protein n=1 Tax=Fructobacillus tropaeoli TaxID=709323 RepID=UPI002D993488|nr:hypothetical protein LMG30237_ALEAABJJ_00412 [Fructobacillus tropaeoli]